MLLYSVYLDFYAAQISGCSLDVVMVKHLQLCKNYFPSRLID